MQAITSHCLDSVKDLFLCLIKKDSTKNHLIVIAMNTGSMEQVPFADYQMCDTSGGNLAKENISQGRSGELLLEQQYKFLKLPLLIGQGKDYLQDRGNRGLFLPQC